MMGEDEDRSLPGAAVRAGMLVAIPAGPATDDRASGFDVLLDQAGPCGAGHPTHGAVPPGDKPVQRHGEVHEKFGTRLLWRGVVHELPSLPNRDGAGDGLASRSCSSAQIYRPWWLVDLRVQ